jgi:hypothetical protein
MNTEKLAKEEQPLQAEWNDLTDLAEDCPEEAEVIMEMLIDSDDEEDEAAA